VTAEFASAEARTLADDLGLDPAAIAGTGRDDAITVADVRRIVPEPPRELGEAGAALWRDVRREWRLRADEAAILEAACHTLDEIVWMEAELDGAGALIPGSRGQLVPHPLIAGVRSHRLALRQLLAALGIREAVEGERGDDDAERSHAGRQLVRMRWDRRHG
jgi:phage terminase small subunit